MYMKYSTKLSDTIHLLSFLCLGEGKKMTSARIAESVKTNPAYIRQLMSALKKAGLISTVQGQAQAALTRSAEQITMLDIYRAVEGDDRTMTKREQNGGDQNGETEENRACSRRRRYEMRI